MIKEIISIWIDHRHLSDSKGNSVDVTSPESLMDFLLRDSSPEVVKCVWNLYSLFGLLSDLIPTTLRDQILKSDRGWYKDYKVFSSSGKVLSISHKEHLHDTFYEPREVNVYGLKQYFPDDKAESLDELHHKALELMLELTVGLNWEFSTLSSAIAIYDDAVLEKQYIPTIYDLPDNEATWGLASYCYKLMNREWRTVYKVGHFPNAMDADLNSGYPSLIRNFGNTSECSIWKSDHLCQSDFGVCKGIVTLNKDYHPIVNKNGQNVVGSYEDILTTEQWGYITHYSIGKFEMQDGYFLKFNEQDDKPFAEIMERLYAMRSAGGLRKTLAKAISVGLYGKFGQEYDERYCEYFNPVYSLMTTSRSSLAVGKFIEKNKLQESLISVAVDGCLASKDIAQPSSKEFGEWRKEQVNALVLSVGNQYLAEKQDSLHNTYSTMIGAIRANPSKQYYNDVLINKGMMTTNRRFLEYPRRGRDLLDRVYESKPIGVTK